MPNPPARIELTVTPKSGRDEVVGRRGGVVLVRVTAPPEGGKANAAVCKVLAKALGVPKSRVRVVRGDTARHKSVEVTALDPGSVDGWMAGLPEKD